MGANPLFHAFQAVSDSASVVILISHDIVILCERVVKSLQQPESHFGNDDLVYNTEALKGRDYIHTNLFMPNKDITFYKCFPECHILSQLGQ